MPCWFRAARGAPRFGGHKRSPNVHRDRRVAGTDRHHSETALHWKNLPDRRSIPARFPSSHTAVSATAALIHGRHAWSTPRVGLTRPARALLVAGIAWGAFAFGAVYPWAYWPLAIATAAAAFAGLAAP